MTQHGPSVRNICNLYLPVAVYLPVSACLCKSLPVSVSIRQCLPVPLCMGRVCRTQPLRIALPHQVSSIFLVGGEGREVGASRNFCWRDVTPPTPLRRRRNHSSPLRGRPCVLSRESVAGCKLQVPKL